MRVPSKLKVFGWSACHEILPTHVNLAKQKITLDNTCHCCKRASETSIHAIWDCGAAQDVWARSLTLLWKCSTNHSDFMQLFEFLLDRLSAIELELFLVQAWTIWNQRNVVVHGGQMKDPGWLKNRAAEFLEEYKKAQENLVVTSLAPSRNVWQPPP